MKSAMITHLAMVVVAGANFGLSRFRSEPFLRRYFRVFHNFQKTGPEAPEKRLFGEKRLLLNVKNSE
jgi:hypothetical protein